MGEADNPHQRAIGRLEGAVAERVLAILVKEMGGAAPAMLDAIEEELVQRYKTSEVPPERDLDHADLNRPVIEEISRLIDGARIEVK